MVAALTSNVGIPPWTDLENLTTVREVQALIGAPENAWRALAVDLGFWMVGSGAAAQPMLIRDWALVPADEYIAAVKTVDVAAGAAPAAGQLRDPPLRPHAVWPAAGTVRFQPSKKNQVKHSKNQSFLQATLLTGNLGWVKILSPGAGVEVEVGFGT